MRLKIGKVRIIDGMVSEMEKSEGEIGIERICPEAWKSGLVSNDWTKAAIFPLYRDKGLTAIVRITGECHLSVTGDVSSRIMFDCVKSIWT